MPDILPLTAHRLTAACNRCPGGAATERGSSISHNLHVSKSLLQQHDRAGTRGIAHLVAPVCELVDPRVLHHVDGVLLGGGQQDGVGGQDLVLVEGALRRVRG